jgi:hypothetical protein
MGDGAGLDHALDGHLVGLFRDLGRGIADEVDLIAIVKGRQGGDGSAHRSPERRDDDFLAAVCCTASTTGVSSQKFIVVRSTGVCPGKTACTVYSANRVIMLFTPVGN